MEFSLVYRGPLEPKRAERRDEKQRLRRMFHPQLQKLWSEPPLNDSSGRWDKTHKHYRADDDITKTIGGFSFVPIVCEGTSLVADLKIDLLRPERPGTIRTSAGDIDNRLKVLLDALRMPRHKDELPDNDAPTNTEQPFFCLLEDDALIHDISVSTHRWLERDVAQADVLMVIRVRTLITRDSMFGSNLGSWMV